MRTKKADKMLRIMAVIAALVMVVALFPASKIETSAASVNTKLYKTISCQLTGRETKIVTFGSDIASITYGSQAPASMKKISARKVEVKGVKNGTTKFYVVTKDKRHITCNVTRNNALIMNTNSTRVIKTATKIKSVKSLNPSIATATLSSGKTFYVVKTKNKKAAARLLVTYADGAKATITLKTNHAHTWVKRAHSEKVKVKDAYDEKVCVKDAYDEQVYVGDRSIQNVTGEDLTDIIDAGKSFEYCESHNCEVHFFGGGPCASDVTVIASYKTVHHDAKYKTVHHDAQYETHTTPAKTHYECKYCGAVK